MFKEHFHLKWYSKDVNDVLTSTIWGSSKKHRLCSKGEQKFQKTSQFQKDVLEFSDEMFFMHNVLWRSCNVIY